MKILKVFLISVLVCACGSSKKTVNEYASGHSSLFSTTQDMKNAAADIQASERNAQIQMTSHEAEDSAEVWMFTTTSWYDTARADSNGIAPLLKHETVASVSLRGAHSRGNAKGLFSSDNRGNLALTSQENIESGVSAETANRVTTERTNTVSNTKPITYVAAGVVLAILMAVLAYWVFTKYRATRCE